MTSDSDLFRQSYSTDLREKDIIFGGAEKLKRAIDEIAITKQAKLIFVYATCIVGVIGDDIEAVCREAEEKHGIRVIPVKAPGFSGTKSQGYKLACDAIMNLIGNSPYKDIKKQGVNILGDFNLAGEIWLIKKYLKKIGIPVVSTITGDSSYASLMKAPSAALNVVQCAGSSVYLAKQMEETFGIPYFRVSFFGVEDTSQSIMHVAEAIGSEATIQQARVFTESEREKSLLFLKRYLPHFEGKKAAIYVGGGFKAISLIRQFREMGIDTVVVGTQTGKKEDYEVIENLVKPNTVILDDTNPAELEMFMRKMHADILVGGVKERPLAYKLGIAFCDHNHERKHALGGYEGVVNFTREVNLSLNSPVWNCLAGR